MTPFAYQVLTILVSAFAVVLSLISVIRATAKQNSDDRAELTTVIVKLENIGSDIHELKNDIRDVSAELKEHSARIVALEKEYSARIGTLEREMKVIKKEVDSAV